MSTHITTPWLCCQVHLDGAFKWPSAANLFGSRRSWGVIEMGGKSLRIKKCKSFKTCSCSHKATLPSSSFQHGYTCILKLGGRHNYKEQKCKWMDPEGRVPTWPFQKTSGKKVACSRQSKGRCPSVVRTHLSLQNNATDNDVNFSCGDPDDKSMWPPRLAPSFVFTRPNTTGYLPPD